MNLGRRELLVSIALATTTAALAACASEPARLAAATAPAIPSPLSPRHRPVPAEPAEPVMVRMRGKPDLVPRTRPPGRLTDLDGQGAYLAWTVDDGADPAVVAAYAEFARLTGVRLTFFLNGKFPAWTEHARALRPLVDSGQAQLANHTFTHRSMPSLGDREMAADLARNARFIHNTYGVDAAPYFRPPYGYIDRRVERVAASEGYHAPTLWYGTLSDSGRITPVQVVDFATKWFLPQHIVIGHANFDGVTKVFDKLLAILDERKLQTVTLRDYYGA